MPTAHSALDTVEAFLARVKQAEAHTEAGSIGGETTHPVKSVDDRTEPAKEGERSKENEKDVKEEQGKPGVNSTPEAVAKAASLASRLAAPTGKQAGYGRNPFVDPADRQKQAEGGAVQTEGSAADDSEKSVLNPQPTGKTPDIETKGAKSGKTDPGSSHPARTDNTDLDGHKYAGDDGIFKMAEDLAAIGNDLCNKIAWISDGSQPEAPAAGKQASAPPQAGDRNTQKQAGAVDSDLQMQLGWEMAGLVTGTMDKVGADAMVRGALEDVVLSASRRAEKVAVYLDNFFATAKQANDPAAGGMPPMDPAAMAGGGGGMPPEAGGGGGMGGDDMMAALGGGGEPGPEAGGGPPAEGGGPPGGGGIDEGQLAMILDQLGVSKEELAAALESEMGGGQPGGEGGGPPAPGGEEHQASDRRGRKAVDLKKVAEVITELVTRTNQAGRK